MTIKHIVLMQFKPTLAKHEIEVVKSSLADLRKHIPQILSFTWGANNSKENLHRGFLHGFEMEFKDDADRQIYLDHPQHVKVAKETVLPALINGVESVVVFDYQT